MSDLGTIIGPCRFKTCLWNAAGARCQSLEELDILYQLESTGAVVTKTCTPLARQGNQGARWYFESQQEKVDISVNSMGLPNLGLDTYLDWIRTQKTNKTTKPIFLSVGGLCWEDYRESLRKIWASRIPIDFIEVNLSCPNLEGAGMVAYDYEALESYIRMLLQYSKQMSFYETRVSCGIKLPPYFDSRQFSRVASILNGFVGQGLKYITCINGIPHGLIIDTETEKSVIHPNRGCGGMGGRLTKAVGLANVYRFRELLDPSIAIIGCGGVSSGEDVFEYILAGAHAVEVGSQLVVEGPECFSRIESEFRDLLKRKNYTRLEDIRGKLQVAS
jgi:dihydroorotate dehydrogenase (fumarate)